MYERIFPLKEAHFYPGHNFIDMVLFFPPGCKQKRLWLLTEAESPKIKIDHYTFLPVNRKQGYSWLDFGITTENIEGATGFAQLKIYGIDKSQSYNSYFVITSQINTELKGTIENVEELLWGIKRKDVGKSWINPSTIEVGRPVIFELVYSASYKGLPPGSFIRFCIPRAFSMPQTEDKNKEGYFTIKETPQPCELLSIDISEESHQKIDVIYHLPYGVPAYGKIKVLYSTNFTYLFPASYNTMERRYWYSQLPPLSVAVAVDKRKIFVPIAEENGHRVEFIPRAQEKIFLFLPGRRHEGENVKLIGILTDKYRNVSSKGLRYNFKIHLKGSEEREIPYNEIKFTSPYRFEINLGTLTEGIYRAYAFTPREKFLCKSNPLQILKTEDERENIYWGEIHAHSIMSDGCGDFTEMFRYAKEIASLDFAAAADHACYFTDNQWALMQDIINSFYIPGKFCTLLGYEWAGKQGHRNIYTSKDKLELFRGMYEKTSEIKKVFEYFKGREDIVIGPHTRHTGDFFSQHDPLLERFLEIYSMWGYFEDIANDLLKKGARIGFTGGGDCHEGRIGFSVEDKSNQGKVPHTFASRICYKCGITGAFMKKLDRDSLIKALRNRKTYATTGARIILDFKINNISMGEEGDVNIPLIGMEIHAEDIIEKIEIIRNGEIIHTIKIGDKMDVNLKWEDQTFNEKAWYYLKIIQKDGEIAWSSPIWVKKS